MSTDQSPSGGGTRSLAAASANNSHNASSGNRDSNNTARSAVGSPRHGNSSGSSPSPHGSGSNSSANRQDSSNTNTSQTRSGAGGGGTGSGAGGSGPRKNSAERSIAHTRMDDESVQKEYKYGQILGEGSFGKVYRAQHGETGEVVAIKEIVKEKVGLRLSLCAQYRKTRTRTVSFTEKVNLRLSCVQNIENKDGAGDGVSLSLNSECSL